MKITATSLLVLINIIFYFFQTLLASYGADITILLAGFPFSSDGFNFISMLTSFFTHGSFGHIFYNLLFFAFFSSEIERRLKISGFGFVLINLLAGVFAFSAWSFDLFLGDFINQTNNINRSYCIGFSGITYFSMGLWFYFNFSNKFARFFIVFEICRFVMQLLQPSSVAGFAHFGGFVFGLLTALILNYFKLYGKVQKK